MSQEKYQSQKSQTEKPQDPYQKYKDFKWQNPESFKNGPIDDESRKCRDCICCIIFLILFALCIIVAGFGFKQGKPSQLFYFYDEDGNACGHDSGFEDYPYLYFTSVIDGLKSFDTNKMLNAVCVKDCPYKLTEFEKVSGSGDKYVTLPCHITSKTTSCDISTKNYYKSKVLFEKICFPRTNKEIEYDPSKEFLQEIYDPESGETFKKVISKDDTTKVGQRIFIAEDAITAEKDAEKASARLINLSYFSQLFTLWINDLYVTRYAILASIGWSFFLAMIYFIFLRCCAGFITFLLILIVQAGLIILAVYFNLLSKKEEEKEAESDTTDYAFFWVFTALAVIWFLFILIMCNRIRLAIALTEVTSKYINKTCFIVFVPFFFFIILVAWLIYWIVLLVYLYTSGEFDKSSIKIFASFKMDEKLEYGFWFHIVMLFYITAIIEAFSQFIYASSACIWYFTF